MTSVFTLVEGPTVIHAVCVVGYEPDSQMRFRAEAAENAFGSFLGGSVKATNVEPNAPAEVPRLSMHQGERVLTIANDRAQLALNFPANQGEIGERTQILEKNLRQFFQCLLQFQSKTKLLQVGVVVELAHRAKVPNTEILEALAGCIYSGRRLGPVASMELKIGFKETNLYVNLGASMYEIREAKFGPGVTSIDVSKLDIQERGLAIQLDVNNRPAIEAQRGDAELGFNEVMARVKALYTGGYKDLIEG